MTDLFSGLAVIFSLWILIVLAIPGLSDWLAHRIASVADWLAIHADAMRAAYAAYSDIWRVRRTR